MDSSGSTVASLATTEASQLLKDILNVGKPRPTGSGDTSLNGVEEESQNGIPSSDSFSKTMEPPSESGTSVDSPEEQQEAATNSLADLIKGLNHKSQSKQQIWLQGDDNANSFAVHGKEVDVVASSRSSNSPGNIAGVKSPAPSSNKIKVNPVCKYEWENKYYVGNLVASHQNGAFMAYVLTGSQTGDGVVRIINRKTTARQLLKHFTGAVTDIAFAHLNAVVLGAVDEVGDMFIFEITGDKVTDPLLATLTLRINRPEGTAVTNNHRLIWCPYIADDGDESGSSSGAASDSGAEDVGKLLVLTHDNVAEMWNIDTVTKEYGSGTMTPDEVEVGFLTISSHTKPIVDAAFAPDGTALATASLDGDVKFFQVYLQDRSPPRCLHQWQPHEGRPISCLFFLDDHKNPVPETQFWKFAVTGADQNREIKLWSCESWTCLQTIRFVQAVSPDLPTNFQDTSFRPCLKARSDLSANYLVLSDIRRNVLFILHIFQEPSTNAAHVSSISEFTLAHPCLSFCVIDADRRRMKVFTEQDYLDEGLAVTKEQAKKAEVKKYAEGPDIGVVVTMLAVHTKVLQHLRIAFKPEAWTSGPAALSMSSTSQDGLKDNLSDLSLVSDAASASQSEIHSLSFGDQSHHRSEVSQNSNTSHVSYHSSQSRHSEGSLHVDPALGEGQQPLLLTPDAFTSPRKTEIPVPGAAGDSVRSSNSSSFTHVTPLDDDVMRTPQSSVLTSQQSSLTSPAAASSISLTPGSGHDTSGTTAAAAAVELTPSSVPLPPVTPGEEAALKTPPESQDGATASRLFPGVPQMSFSPSAAQTAAAETASPVSSVRTSSEAGVGVGSGEEGGSARRTALQSTGSSSSTSLEVSEILEGVSTRSDNVPPDEGEEDVAGARTEDVEEEEFEDAKGDIEDEEGEEAINNVQLHQRGDASTEPETPAAETEGAAAESATYSEKIWPMPPDVKKVELQEQALVEDLGPDGAPRTGYHVDAEEAEELGPHQEEGDVEVEEEKEEEEMVIVDEEDDDDDEEVIIVDDISEPPKATSRSESVQVSTAVLQLQTSVQQMLSMLQYQQREIESIRSELTSKEESGQVMTSLQAQMDSLEGALASRVAASLSEHTQSETERLHGLLTEKEALERQKQERLLNTVSQTLDRTISSRLDKTVREEMRQRVIPALARSMDPLKEQLHLEMMQRITATDKVVKENLTALVRSRQTVDTIGQAAGNAIQGPIHGAIRDLVVPGFERATQNMLHQVNETLQRGTHDYIGHLERHVETVRKKHEAARDPIVTQLRSMVDSIKKKDESHEPMYRQLNTIVPALQSSMAQMQSNHQKLEEHIKQSFISLERSLKEEMKELVRQEISEALKEQQTTISESVVQSLRSGAVTPALGASAATPDPAVQRAQISNLLEKGQLNEAFQLALSASDLTLVMSLCEAVNPSQVFNQVPCPLRQPVLLSLIQQLSADLINQTELKHKYLEEAVMNLDSSNPLTKEHMAAVLGALSHKLSTFIQRYPQEKMTRNIRMLLMATNSLLK